MPSLITSVIGGIQGASAAHNASTALQTGYGQAGTTVTNAVNQVNPGIITTAGTAGQGVTTAAGQAGTGATGAAATGAQGATSAANDLTTALNPYISAGATAAEGLTAASQPFTAQMMSQYSPAYQFQLQQGQQAAARQAAAMGVTGSGGTAKALQQYAQNYAGTAFGNASNLYNQNFQRLCDCGWNGTVCSDNRRPDRSPSRGVWRVSQRERRSVRRNSGDAGSRVRRQREYQRYQSRGAEYALGSRVSRQYADRSRTSTSARRSRSGERMEQHAGGNRKHTQ